MKKNDWILFTAIVLYSYLFYQQLPGINFFIFSMALTLLLGLRNPAAVKSTNWRIVAAGAIISGFLVMWHGNMLSVIANVLSLTVLSVYTFTASSSFLIAVAHSAYSIVTATYFLIKDYGIKQRKQKIKDPFTGCIKILIWLIPLLISVVFFIIYREANPVFHNLTKNISIDFISVEWFLFTLVGAVILHGLLFPRKIRTLFILDRNAKDNFDSSKLIDYNTTWFGKNVGLKNEAVTGSFLFILLNILLLSLNLVDINYLWIDQRIPDGMTYSQYVHQGTGLIIFSVISAIFIILFFFRGHLNFYENNNFLKLLAYAWIIQNIFMVVSTGYRNQLYIETFGLTYKRLGVNMYLLLTLIGLLTTFIKVKNIKSNWFLFRKNAWIFYTIFILACIVNWDRVITNYNLENSRTTDMEYLVNLGYSNIPQFMDANPEIFADDSIYSGSMRIISLKNQLRNKIKDFENEYRQAGWQSWCFHKQEVYKRIRDYRNNYN